MFSGHAAFTAGTVHHREKECAGLSFQPATGGLPAAPGPLESPAVSTSTALEAAVVPPSEAPVVEAFGDRVTFHLTGAQTGGKYTAFVVETPPGSGPPPHWHDREDEWFLVLEGQAEFFKDGTWTPVPAGSAVFAPRGSVHAFRNAGDTMLKQAIHTAPSGFEDFFTRIAEEFHREGGPDMARVVEISAGFGIHYA